MTQYSTEERKAIADAFRQTKKYLNKGNDEVKTSFICLALDKAFVNGEIDIKEIALIKTHILLNEQ